MKALVTTPAHVVRVRAALIALAAVAILALALFQVHRRHQVIRLGYELSDTGSQLRRLQEEERRLRLELSVLTSPERIERLATSLGMVRPGPDQVRTAGQQLAAAEARE